jgi:hypothetical protein
LLESEGIEIVESRVELAKHLWSPPKLVPKRAPKPVRGAK